MFRINVKITALIATAVILFGCSGEIDGTGAEKKSNQTVAAGLTYNNADIGLKLVLPQNYEEVPKLTSDHHIFSVTVREYDQYQPRFLLYAYPSTGKTAAEMMLATADLFAQKADDVQIISKEELKVDQQDAARLFFHRRSETGVEIIMYYLFLHNNNFDIHLVYGNALEFEDEVRAYGSFVESNIKIASTSSIRYGISYVNDEAEMMFTMPSGYLDATSQFSGKNLKFASVRKSHDGYAPRFIIEVKEPAGTAAQIHDMYKDFIADDEAATFVSEASLTLAGTEAMRLVSRHVSSNANDMLVVIRLNIIRNNKHIYVMFVDEEGNYESTTKREYGQFEADLRAKLADAG